MKMGRLKSKKTNVPQRSKLKKDPGVPKLPDLKTRNAEKQRLNATRHEKGENPDRDSAMASEPTLSTLALLAAEAEERYPSPDPASSSSQNQTMEQQRKHFVRSLHKVIDESDIVVLVLDARDPEGCRSRLVEEEVLRRESEGKTLVFVLNKIDLIPKDNAQAWLKHLRHSTPTLPFRCATSTSPSQSTATAPSLLKLLKAYKPKSGSVTVGIVGYPNVGKSSLINSLKRSKVCAVAAQPGHTKALQSIQLERGMRIIDSPGVVFDDADGTDEKGVSKKGSILLRNVVKVEDIEDPIAVVEEIVVRTQAETLRDIYRLPKFSSTIEFLTMNALNSGRLLKGGTPDLLSAGRQILSDWNHHKIPYFSVPPTVHPSQVPSTVPATQGAIAPGAESVGQAQILPTYSKPFTLEGLFGSADQGAFAGDVDMDEDVFYDAEEGMDLEQEDGDLNMDNPDTDLSLQDASFVSSTSRKRRHSPSPEPLSDDGDLPLSQQMQQDGVDSPRHPLRKSKRQRKNVNNPDYDARPIGNALSRKNLKREAKKARKVANARMKAAVGQMEVDGMGLEEGLAFTFVA